MAPPMAKIFTLDPEMKTVPFGMSSEFACLVELSPPR
jgi:hypothetical protein